MLKDLPAGLRLIQQQNITLVASSIAPLMLKTKKKISHVWHSIWESAHVPLPMFGVWLLLTHLARLDHSMTCSLDGQLSCWSHLTYRLSSLPSLLVLFHMPKHLNDICFQAFSGLAELMERGSYRAEQSADLFFSGRQNKSGGERRGKIQRSQIKGTSWVCLRIFSLFFILNISIDEKETFPISKRGNLPV